ncbi:MAG: DUF4981 domain-containing protein [Eubacteriales bacterium]|nr:DUF4981 domain-containing protein [Eubacteriales bacterium]
MQRISYDLGYLCDPEVFAVGRLPAVSDHDTYAGAAEAACGCSSLRRSLNGRWKFHYAQTPQARPVGFEQPGYDCAGWAEIDVPGHIQLQGYGKPQYINTQYPWDGRDALTPPQIPAEDNPVGSYVTEFEVPASWADKRVTLTFNGVESACFVWVNGVLLGYAEDSFTPSRFDASAALVPGRNRLAVEVFRFCSGSWLEDQDFWRFSGIFREAELRAEPRAHVEDLFVHAVPAEDLLTGELSVEAVLTLPREPVTLTAELLDGDGKSVERFSLPAEERLRFTRKVTAPRLWSAEQPNLYTLRLTLHDASGAEREVAQTELGFRRFEIRNGLMLLNGKRILLHGVDRHEFGCHAGRALSEADMLWDVRMMKKNNINAVRTSHYPNQSLWYRLCDRYGIYLIDETNLETHGTWSKLNKLTPETALPGDHEEWLGACLDRAGSMLERDKNHPSVLLWSCGNESFGGKVIYAMSEFFRHRDASRPVHYEGVFNDRRYNQTSDVESRMYPPAANVAAWLETHTDKPFLLCEYSHAMGNSCGGLSEYLALEDRCRQYQGGFIWDWIDQAIDAPLPGGQRGLAFGGDFFDQPNDRNFCGNGLAFADRTPTPKLMEVKYLYQNVHIRPEAQGVILENRHLFDDLRGYRLTWMLLQNGENVAQGTLENVTVPPGESRFFPLPIPAMPAPGEYALTCELRLKAVTLWAEAGYALMHGQAVLAGEPQAALPPVSPIVPYRIAMGGQNVGTRGGETEALFSLIEGGLVSFGRRGQLPLLNFAPRPSLYRATTDNDAGNHFAQQTALWRAFSELAVGEATGGETEGGRLTVKYRFRLPSLTDAEMEVAYEMLSANRVLVEATLTGGDNLPELAAMGLSFRLPREMRHVRYYGMGPWENETDRKAGATLGYYETTADENLTPYLKPQACGNRTGVRWLTAADGEGRTLRISMVDAPLQISVLPYSQATLTSALHRQELPAPAYTFLDVASARCGVGGDNSWGAPVLAHYRLPASLPMRLRFVLEVC